MNKAFTLIELMISVTILIFIGTGGTVYYNNFNSKQKLDKVKTDIVSMIDISRNNAKTRQGSSAIKYVLLYKDSADGKIKSKNDLGVEYFANKISEQGIGVTFSSSPLYFWGGTGGLSTNATGTFYSPSQTATITITLNTDISETRTIIINYLGGVE